MSSIWTNLGSFGSLLLSAFSSEICELPYTRTLSVFFLEAPAFICSLKKSITSFWVNCFSAATCFIFKKQTSIQELCCCTKNARSNCQLFALPVSLKSHLPHTPGVFMGVLSKLGVICKNGDAYVILPRQKFKSPL